MIGAAFLDIPPLTGASGQVALPGSKSISNRVLLLSALASGTTTLSGMLESDDTRVMLAALAQLGCAFERHGDALSVTGLDSRIPKAQARLFLGNAGTAMRPLTAALALIGGDFELSGVARMHERPIGDLVDALRLLGCRIDYLGNEGFPPLRIGQPSLDLERPIQVRGDVSSQFLTSLLMALPLVARRDIAIEVVGELISKPYIEITLKLLGRFGVAVARDGWRSFTIPAGSRLISPGNISVEADASSASYLIALGGLVASENGQKRLEISGVGTDSIQGDIRFVEAAQSMGVQVIGGPGRLSVSRGSWPLKAIDLDCNHIPDAAMTLAVMALYADGPSTLRNIASWRVKETDRIAAMANELRKLGAKVQEGADFLRITPPARPEDWRAATIETYDDHRIAMCFSLAALNPAGLPVRILDPKCVAKTFPDYFEALFSVAETPARNIPVICIDGPSASGKGTLAAAVAARLGWQFLDSGSLYRLVGLAAERAGLAIDAGSAEAIAELAQRLPVRFVEDRIHLGEADVTDAIRSEHAGRQASAVSALQPVRAALVALQHSFRRLPGLVADGRDMGTVIFPDAPLKVYLTASVDERAERRHKQLISKGISVTLTDLCADLQARDTRDSSRAVAPLKPAEDAVLLDNSHLSIAESVDQVLAWWERKQPFEKVSSG
ncbi:MAG: bifunctional 3-phosphoshikimate 1-carboxyvinyltransferase/cytidylate kinase [Burkholderiales bacterium]